MIHKGIGYEIAMIEPGLWKWQFRIGAMIKSGRTKASLELLADRRVRITINRELRIANSCRPATEVPPVKLAQKLQGRSDRTQVDKRPAPRAASHGSRRGVSNAHRHGLHAHRTMQQPMSLGAGPCRTYCRSAGRHSALPIPDGAHKKRGQAALALVWTDAAWLR